MHTVGLQTVLKF